MRTLLRLAAIGLAGLSVASDTHADDEAPRSTPVNRPAMKRMLEAM